MKHIKLLSLCCVLLAACSNPGENLERNALPSGSKADSIGSCAGSCGDVGSAGDCYCDDLCSSFGDCCSDVALECQLDECDPFNNTGCGYGELCSPGLCLAFCQPDDPGCCSPATCAPLPSTCEFMGGSCESSPTDPTFSASCEFELGRETIVGGSCAAFNQSCCGAPLCPQINPPAPGFCDDDEELSSVIDDNGCVVGFECIGLDSCEAIGGFCSPASVGCPADTGTNVDFLCGDADSVCCETLIFPF